MVDEHVGLFEAGDDHRGEVGIVLDEQDVGRAFAGVEHARKFGEEQVLVEWLLHPALGLGSFGVDPLSELPGCGVDGGSTERMTTGMFMVAAEFLSRLQGLPPLRPGI